MDSNFSINTANLSQTFLIGDNKSDTMNYTYCNLKDFEISYRQIHGYLSIFVCVFGSITNVVNIVVLTSPTMRWPTNFILTGLAIADLMVMLVYIPFASHNYLDPEERYFARYFSYPWALYMYFQALFTQICHFISCCLTVMLAVWRYLAITEPLNSKIWCNPYRTKIGIFLTYALCPVVCLPLIFGLYVNTSEHLIYANDMLVPEGKVPKYNLSQNLTAIINVLAIDEEYRTFNFWVYSVVIKFVPSVLLTVLSAMLIWALLEAKRRSERLNNNSANDGKARVEAVNTTRESSIALLVTKTSTKTQRNAEKEQQAIRTNRMLLAVLLLFLMTEFPQAILGLLSVILGNQFQMQCYFRLGDVFDMVALTNSAINFILYCSMSSQFRAAFKAIHLHPIFLTKWKSVSSQITEVHQPSEVQVTQL